MKKYILPVLIIGSILMLYLLYFLITVFLDAKPFIDALKETGLLGIVATAITVIVLIFVSKKDSDDDDK